MNILAINDNPISDMIRMLNWYSVGIGTKNVDSSATIVVPAAPIIDKPVVSSAVFTASNFGQPFSHSSLILCVVCML